MAPRKRFRVRRQRAGQLGARIAKLARVFPRRCLPPPYEFVRKAFFCHEHAHPRSVLEERRDLYRVSNFKVVGDTESTIPSYKRDFSFDFRAVEFDIRLYRAQAKCFFQKLPRDFRDAFARLAGRRQPIRIFVRDLDARSVPLGREVVSFIL